MLVQLTVPVDARHQMIVHTLLVFCHQQDLYWLSIISFFTYPLFTYPQLLYFSFTKQFSTQQDCSQTLMDQETPISPSFTSSPINLTQGSFSHAHNSTHSSPLGRFSDSSQIHGDDRTSPSMSRQTTVGSKNSLLPRSVSLSPPASLTSFRDGKYISLSSPPTRSARGRSHTPTRMADSLSSRENSLF